MRLLPILLGAALLLGCPRGEQKPPPRLLPPPLPAPEHPRARQAFRACFRVANEGPGKHGAHMALILRACAGIYSRAKCVSAFGDAARSDPAARAAIIAKGCRAAYCRVLEQPGPALCSAKLPRAGHGALGLWLEFDRAIARRDFGRLLTGTMLAFRRQLAEWLIDDSLGKVENCDQACSANFDRCAPWVYRELGLCQGACVGLRAKIAPKLARCHFVCESAGGRIAHARATTRCLKQHSSCQDYARCIAPVLRRK